MSALDHEDVTHSDLQKKLEVVIENQARAIAVVNKLEARFEEYLPELKNIKRVAEKKAKLHAAIVEKSVVGIVWAGILLIGLSVWEFIKTGIHG